MCIHTVEGFCNKDTTKDGNRGIFEWQESSVNFTDVRSCPFGPTGAVGTRMCASHLIWDDPVLNMCRTLISWRFIELNESLNDVWEVLMH